jgi:hypothetical protein
MGVSKNGLVYNGKSHENRWFGDTYISGTHPIWFQHSKNMFDHVWKHQARWHFVIGCLKHQETIHHAHSIGSIFAKWHLHLHCPIWGFNRVSQHWNRQVLGKITRFMLVKHHSLRTQFGHCLLRTRTVQPFGDDYSLQFTSFQCLRSEVLIKFIQITIIYPHYIPIICPLYPLWWRHHWWNLDPPLILSDEPRSKTRHLNRRVARIVAEDLLEHHQEKLTAPGRIDQRVKARNNVGI